MNREVKWLLILGELQDSINNIVYLVINLHYLALLPTTVDIGVSTGGVHHEQFSRRYTFGLVR